MCTRAFPACRHAAGTISSSAGADVWRMASEDSDQFGPGLSAVHRLRDLRDLDQPWGCEMQAGIDERHAIRELLEVLLFGGPHRVLHEERNDRPQQIRAL